MIVDVLVPADGRADALAITLATLVGQTHRSLRVLITDAEPAEREPLIAVLRVLAVLGIEVLLLHPPAGVDRRAFLLDHAREPHLLVEPGTVLEPEAVASVARTRVA
jgi:hypothetical protein